MNQRYHNQQNRNQNSSQNGNRPQYNSYRGQFSRKEQLERDLQYFERDLISLDTQIDALSARGNLLEAAKNAHMASIPFAIGQAALSALGVRYLPPVARTWHYKHQQLLRAQENLKQYALSLYTKRAALIAQIEQVEVQIEMLQYQP